MRRIGLFLEIGFLDARGELVGRKGGGRVADHALVFGKLILDQEGVVPDEGGGLADLAFNVHGKIQNCPAAGRMRQALSSATGATSQKPVS